MTVVAAHTTGTVWRIEVRPGDHVDAGDIVVILESMKMETPVEADEEGTVARVLVEEGQTVHEGEPVVELD